MRDKRKDSYERLIHVKDSIEKIEYYTNKIDSDIFLSDDLISSAVLFQFSVIGEAIIHIESDLLEGYDYEWYKVRSFRNFTHIIHAISFV